MAQLLCVVAPVRLDNPNVVIDVMTRIQDLFGTAEESVEKDRTADPSRTKVCLIS
jgi:hypothetical protein